MTTALALRANSLPAPLAGSLETYIQHVGRIISAPVLGGLHHHYSRI